MTLKRLKILAIAALISVGGAASASTMTLDSTTQCSTGNAGNNIVVGDVTGNAGGATDCWGTFDGNDPGPSSDGFKISDMTYGFVAKYDVTEDKHSGVDINLVVGGVPGSSGTWSFASLPAAYGDFIIVLKAANTPGFAAWLFADSHAASTSGDWNVAWFNKSGKPPGLSHLAVYAKMSAVPLPAAGFLLIGALGGLVGLRRRRKAA